MSPKTPNEGEPYYLAAAIIAAIIIFIAALLGIALKIPTFPFA
ncbi:MAG TPA: hypothetical protein VJB62_03410 [Patescibacteria group bacterium]|nr:hypothetical protein [Patescibacteria group bacterium]